MLLKKKKKLAKETSSDLMKAHIDALASNVLDYIRDEPLFALNYKQMLLSDGKCSLEIKCRLDLWIRRHFGPVGTGESHKKTQQKDQKPLPTNHNRSD